MGLKEVIAGKETPGADQGVIVKRCLVWRPALALAALVAGGLWLYDYLLHGLHDHKPQSAFHGIRSLPAATWAVVARLLDSSHGFDGLRGDPSCWYAPDIVEAVRDDVVDHMHVCGMRCSCLHRVRDVLARSSSCALFF